MTGLGADFRVVGVMDVEIDFGLVWGRKSRD